MVRMVELGLEFLQNVMDSHLSLPLFYGPGKLSSYFLLFIQRIATMIFILGSIFVFIICLLINRAMFRKHKCYRDIKSS